MTIQQLNQLIHKLVLIHLLWADPPPTRGRQAVKKA